MSEPYYNGINGFQLNSGPGVDDLLEATSNVLVDKTLIIATAEEIVEEIIEQALEIIYLSCKADLSRNEQETDNNKDIVGDTSLTVKYLSPLEYEIKKMVSYISAQSIEGQGDVETLQELPPFALQEEVEDEGNEVHLETHEGELFGSNMQEEVEESDNMLVIEETYQEEAQTEDDLGERTSVEITMQENVNDTTFIVDMLYQPSQEREIKFLDSISHSVTETLLMKTAETMLQETSEDQEREIMAEIVQDRKNTPLKQKVKEYCEEEKKDPPNARMIQDILKNPEKIFEEITTQEMFEKSEVKEAEENMKKPEEQEIILLECVTYEVPKEEDTKSAEEITGVEYKETNGSLVKTIIQEKYEGRERNIVQKESNNGEKIEMIKAAEKEKEKPKEQETIFMEYVTSEGLEEKERKSAERLIQERNIIKIVMQEKFEDYEKNIMQKESSEHRRNYIRIIEKLDNTEKENLLDRVLPDKSKYDENNEEWEEGEELEFRVIEPTYGVTPEERSTDTHSTFWSNAGLIIAKDMMETIVDNVEHIISQNLNIPAMKGDAETMKDIQVEGNAIQFEGQSTKDDQFITSDKQDTISSDTATHGSKEVKEDGSKKDKKKWKLGTRMKKFFLNPLRRNSKQ